MDDKKKTDILQMNGLVEAQEPEEKPDDRFPRSIPFIIGNEFCERFCYYGMRAVLTLYFVNVFNYSEAKATEGFHLFAMCAYFTPLLGAFIADSYLGKYLTILYLSIVYVAGNLLLSSASYLQSEVLTITGLGFIALGTGGIKPCVSAFGGDQFKKNQAHLLDKFFSAFYAAINLGSVVSMFVTPIFRSDISCFGQPSCYPLAFGVPALLMIIALVLFLVGSPLYVKLPSAKGNIVVQFVSCIIYSFYKKMANLFSGEPKPSHFLDYSASKYPSNIIEDGKSVLSVFLLFIPLPIFWSLYDQQGSTFVLQAQHMNGDIGILGWNYTLRPDQFQVINPLLVLIMIPLFDYVIYPTLKKFSFCTKPLQRMGLGGLLAASAFFCAALLELHTENSKVLAPIEGQTNLNLILLNSKPIQTVHLENSEQHLQKINDELNNRFIDFGTVPAGTFTLNGQLANEKNFTQSLNLSEKSINTVVVFETANGLAALVDSSNEIMANYTKLQLKIYLNQEEYQKKMGKPIDFLMIRGVTEKIALPVDRNLDLNSAIWTKTVELDEVASGYDILVNEKPIYKFTGQNARSYKLVILAKDEDNFDVSKYEWINFKQVSMCWQLIQYFVLTSAEIALSITGLNFSYSEAPASMKSVVTAAWLFTTAIGNFLVVVVTSLAQFDSPAMSFFFYGFLMFVDMLLFILLAYFYKPRTPNNVAEDKEVLELRNSGESLNNNNLAN